MCTPEVPRPSAHAITTHINHLVLVQCSPSIAKHLPGLITPPKFFYHSSHNLHSCCPICLFKQFIITGAPCQMGYNVNIKGKAEYNTGMKMKLPVFGYFCTEHRAQLHQIEDFLDNEWGCLKLQSDLNRIPRSLWPTAPW